MTLEKKAEGNPKETTEQYLIDRLANHVHQMVSPLLLFAVLFGILAGAFFYPKTFRSITTDVPVSQKDKLEILDKNLEKSKSEETKTIKTNDIHNDYLVGFIWSCVLSLLFLFLGVNQRLQAMN